MYVSIYLYIYICIDRERDRERYAPVRSKSHARVVRPSAQSEYDARKIVPLIYIYIYICICICGGLVKGGLAIYVLVLCLYR